jgi:hypothetical protein
MSFANRIAGGKKLPPVVLKLMQADAGKKHKQKLKTKLTSQSSSTLSDADIDALETFLYSDDIDLPSPPITANNPKAIEIAAKIETSVNGDIDGGSDKIVSDIRDKTKELESIRKETTSVPASVNDDTSEDDDIIKLTNEYKRKFIADIKPIVDIVTKLDAVVTDVNVPTTSKNAIDTSGILTPFDKLTFVEGSIPDILSSADENGIKRDIDSVVVEATKNLKTETTAVDIFDNTNKINLEDPKAKEMVLVTKNEFEAYGDFLKEQMAAFIVWVNGIKITGTYKLKSALSSIFNSIITFLTSTLQVTLLNVYILVKKYIQSIRQVFKSTKEYLVTIKIDGDYSHTFTIIKKGNMTDEEFAKVFEKVKGVFPDNGELAISGDAITAKVKYTIAS